MRAFTIRLASLLAIGVIGNLATTVRGAVDFLYQGGWQTAPAISANNYTALSADKARDYTVYAAGFGRLDEISYSDSGAWTVTGISPNTYTSVVADGVGTIKEVYAAGAGGLDYFYNYDNGSGWTNRVTLSANSYAALAADTHRANNLFAARSSGGLDNVAYYSGGWHVDTVNTNSYTSLITDRVDSANTQQLFGARAGGGLDSIRFSGGWQTQSISANSYVSLAPDYSRPLNFLGARAGGGLDNIGFYGGAWHVDPVNSKQYVGVTVNEGNPGQDFFGALAGGGVERIYYDAGWQTELVSPNKYTTLVGDRGASGQAEFYRARTQSVTVDTTLVSESATRYRTWQAFRPFTQTAWETHGQSSGPNQVNVPYFLGSGLNTAWDGVRSGSETLQHPNTNGLPTILMGQQAYQPDLNAFINDFNLAKTFSSNLIGVNLGDEVKIIFGQGGLNHGRVVRDWIVQNPDPTISSLVTISSNPDADNVVDIPTTQDLWNTTLHTSKPDVWLAQMYPFTGAGVFPKYYRSLQWYRDWSRSNGVAMWIYPQAYGSTQAAVPSESELRLQRFTSLAYGTQGFSDFLWYSGPGSPTQPGTGYWANDATPQNPAGVPTAMYQQLAPINREIDNLAQSLIRLTQTRAYHLDGEAGVFQFSNSDADLPAQSRRTGNLTSVTSSNANHVMTGFFRDLAGEEYFMVVNKSSAENSTGAQLSSSVTLTFAPSVTAIRRLRRSDGKLETLPLGAGHTFTFPLTGGTGDLFKIDDGIPFMGVERLHYENFEGPYSRSTPLPLNTLDPTWTSGGVTSLHGAAGSLEVKDVVGVGSSRGATGSSISGLRGNERRIPAGPLFTSQSLLIVEGDLHLMTPLGTLGSGQFANLLVANSGATSQTPTVDLKVGSGDFVIDAASLGGLPSPISLSSGAGANGEDFHLTLEFNLAAKQLRASVSGDAGLTTDWLSYSGTFSPAQIGIIAGSFGSSSSIWDNVSVTSLALPAVSGDYNNNGSVDAADYVLWRKGMSTGSYDLWRSRFGATSGSGSELDLHTVPEPSVLAQLIAGSIVLLLSRTLRRRWAH